MVYLFEKTNSVALITIGCILPPINIYSKNFDKELKRPNVIVILTDDQGWGDFEFNGNKYLKTPILDSLLLQSAHFTNFYVSPLSATTRAGLLTGRYHIRTGALAVTRSAENMDENEYTLAELFRDNNYDTGCFGKWHNGAHYPQDPNGQGFQEFLGFCAGHLINYFNPQLQHNQEFSRKKGYITDILTDNAIRFISKKRGKPFFCYIPYNAPHAPYQVPDEYYNHYKYLQKDSMDMTPAVYAMCENLDTNIGRILTTLHKQKIDDNTIVVFMSDNGPNNKRYNGCLKGLKGQTYEGGIKVPCLIYWKGKIVPSTIDNIGTYIDILPTLTDLCQLKSNANENKEVDGVSLVPLLKGDKEKASFYDKRFNYTHRSYSNSKLSQYDGLIFNRDYKLLIRNNNSLELYNKINDPSELHNLYDDNRTFADSLKYEYDKWFDVSLKEYQCSCKRATEMGLLNSESYLPAHEACKSGTIRYNRNIYGWAGDWLTDINLKDSVVWDVDIEKSGDYVIKLQYALPINAEKDEVRVISLNNDNMTNYVRLSNFKSSPLPCPDRVERVEAYEQTWKVINLGTVKLDKGKDRLLLNFKSDLNTLKGLDIKGIYIKPL